MAWWEERRRFIEGYLAIWRSDAGVLRIAALAGAVAVFQLLGVLLAGRSGVPLALAAPLAAVFGPAGGWGAVLGAIFGELALGRIGAALLLEAFGVLLAALVGWALWLRLAYPYRKNPLTAAVGILPVSIAATVLGTVSSIAMVSLFLDRGFVAPMPGAVVDHLLLAVLLGPPIAVVGVHRDEIPVTGMTIAPTQWLISTALVGVITLAWLVTGISIGMFRTDLRANPYLREELSRQLPPVIDAIAVYVSGPLGWTLQVILAAISIGLVVAVITTTSHRPTRFRVPRLARG